MKVKKLLKGVSNSSGRNNTGHITMYYRGGGNKKRYRFIDFRRSLWNVKGRVLRFELDVNRTARLALIFYRNGILSYILAPDKLLLNSEVETGTNIAHFVTGNALPLVYIPIGILIHNIELHPMGGGQICRAAGTCAKIVKKNLNYVLLKLSSGEQRYFYGGCLATVGKVSKVGYKSRKLWSAGQKRLMNRRPRTRAAAMNPVDHPLGGRTRGGKIPVSFTGKKIGPKTRRTKNKFVLRYRDNSKNTEVKRFKY